MKTTPRQRRIVPGLLHGLALSPVLSLVLSLVLTQTATAETLTFDSAASWSTWEAPYGLTQIGDQGQLQLVKSRKDTDVMADAHLFTHKTSTRGDAVPGGIWDAGSGQATAPRAIDGDPETFWQPDPDDVLGEWFIQIDLGRTVLARQIRLVFPDRDGARPLRQFTVFTATGGTSDPIEDLFLFEPAFRTTQPNNSTELIIPLQFVTQDSARVLDQDLEVDPVEKNHFRLIQYINITVEAKSLDAALAEVEVIGIGDNVSIGTDRRGSVLDGLTARGNLGLLDADMNTNSAVAPVTFEGRQDTWETQGTWFFMDLGAVFWLDEMFIYILREQEGTAGFIAGPARGFTFLASDGRRSIGTGLPIPEPIDFDELLSQPDPEPNTLRYLRYLFNPRRIRYLFWFVHDTRGWNSKWTELMLFSPGHPAQVVLRSDFIDLSQTTGDGRPKVIRSLTWDADLPAGTRFELRSRSGNALSELYTFHDRSGAEVTESKWSSSPKVLRGKVDTSKVVSEDWDEWSVEYKLNGEPFKSQSPRRFVQLEMILSTDDPQVAATVNALSIDFEDAFLQEARGSIDPRAATPNEDTRFTYTLWPAAGDDDSGFDRMRFGVPSPVDAATVAVTVAGQTVVPTRVEAQDDSLLIVLPQTVRTDSVEVSFSARVLHNATVFGLDLGLDERPNIWQSVEAAQRRSNIVLLPALADSRQLINDLVVPAAFSPNGDGVNDALELSFVPFKVVGTDAAVSVYDLAGRRIVALAPTTAGTRQRFTWTGRDDQGALVQPGIYLLRLDLGADAGEDTALRPVVVAY